MIRARTASCCGVVGARLTRSNSCRSSSVTGISSAFNPRMLWPPSFSPSILSYLLLGRCVLAVLRRLISEPDQQNFYARLIVVDNEERARSLIHLKNLIIILKQAKKQ